MIKKIIAWMLIIATTAAITVGGTLAYLTDRDSEANVFTVGDVKIDLNEDFNQGSTLIPGVDIEKEPTVTNVGPNDAWVWTQIAIPAALDSDDASKNVIHFNYSKDAEYNWTWTEDGQWLVEQVKIGDVMYNVYTALYDEVLAPGETTEYPVIYKVYMDHHVDIDPDGNWHHVLGGEVTDIAWNTEDNGNPIIYVSAYAMQEEGFDTCYDAYVAYHAQWGDKANEWGKPDDLIWNEQEMNASTNKSGTFVLGDDITTSGNATVPGTDRYGYGYEYIIRGGVDYTLDLNGKGFEHEAVNNNGKGTGFTYLFVANNAGTKLTIDGNGKVHCSNSEGYTCAVQGKDGTLITINSGDFQVDNGIAVWAGAGSHIIINGGSFVNDNAKTDHELIYSSGGVIDIYGGFFHNADGNYTLNVEDKNRATGFINVYGGTFVNFDPSTGGQDPNNIKVADGYKVISETQANGDTWYTVVKK